MAGSSTVAAAWEGAVAGTRCTCIRGGSFQRVCLALCGGCTVASVVAEEREQWLVLTVNNGESAVCM